MSGIEPAGSGTSTLGFRPGLDGIRAVAVMAVMAYHFGAPWMRGGFLGVDLFMVLSGYLITSLLILEHDRAGRVALGQFWVRRLRRILPAVMLLMVAIALYAAIEATSIERASLRWDAMASLTSWANWRLISEGSGYWAAFGPPSPLTHFWSLAVEEQFYLFWPLVVAAALAASGGRQMVVATVAIVGIIASAVTMALVFDPAAPSRAYLGTDSRAQTLLIGALGAVLLRPSTHRVVAARSVWKWWGAAAAVFVVVALFTVHDQAAWMYHGGFTAFAVAALVVVVVASESGGIIRRMLSVPVLVWIGQRSFGWYLWHWPLIVLLTPERIRIDGAARVVVLLILTVVAAEVSFRVVEQPARRVQFHLGARRLPVPAVALAALIVVGAALVLTTRVPPPARPDLTASSLSLESTPATSADATPADDSPTPGPSSGTEPVPVDQEPERSARPIERVVIQGDSVALFAALPMIEAFGAAGIAVDNRTFPGQSLANLAVIDAVAESGADLSIWHLTLWDTGDPADVRADHERFIEATLAIGADVIFIDRPPVRSDLETPERQLTRQIAAELAAANPGRVHLLDPSAVWGFTAELDRNGDRLPERFRDLVHVCPQGSAEWTAWLLRELAERYTAVVIPDPTTWIDGAWLDDAHWAANPGQCDPV